jgi:hypothetical protein
MPEQDEREEAEEGRSAEVIDENHFSQEDDDLAGRSWHGMNSDVDQVGRFDTDEDTEDDAARKRPSS